MLIFVIDLSFGWGWRRESRAKLRNSVTRFLRGRQKNTSRL
jgi:hypothetical protein